jgi:hypothetical protein
VNDVLQEIIFWCSMAWGALQVIVIIVGTILDRRIPRDPRFEGARLWYRS